MGSARAHHHRQIISKNIGPLSAACRGRWPGDAPSSAAPASPARRPDGGPETERAVEDRDHLRLPEGNRGWDHYRETGTRQDYVAMLERADQGIGRILEALDRLKLAQNTLVIVTSDNGGEWLSRNAPLFHRKGTLWEGGIRVPLLLRWPARLAAGTISSQVGITMDLTASIVAAAGVKPPDSYRPEGIDLVGLLQKGTAVDRTLFWRMPPAPGAAGTPPVTQRAVRRGNWKYIDDRGQYLLFDLHADPGERHDVAQQHADLVRELRSLVAKWEAGVDAESKERTPAR